jgi:hypothetical protein
LPSNSPNTLQQWLSVFTAWWSCLRQGIYI